MCIGCQDQRAEKPSRAFGFIHSVLCWGGNHWGSRLTKWQGHLEGRASEKQAKCHGAVSCRHQQKLAWSSFSSVTFVAQQQANLLILHCRHFPHCHIPRKLLCPKRQNNVTVSVFPFLPCKRLNTLGVSVGWRVVLMEYDCRFDSSTARLSCPTSASNPLFTLSCMYSLSRRFLSTFQGPGILLHT